MSNNLSANALASQAEARMDSMRCDHIVLRQIDGINGWYRCQNCGDIMEFPTVMQSHPPSDLRRMIHWFQLELERWPDGPNPPSDIRQTADRGLSAREVGV